MTDRDVLERASRALREQAEPSPEELAELRRRVLTSNVKPLPTRRITRSARWVLPLAAAFMAATALAATPGAWQGMLEAAERFLHIQLLPAEQRAQKVTRQKAVTAQPSALPPVLETAPAVVETAEQTAEQVPEHTPATPPTTAHVEASAQRARRPARSLAISPATSTETSVKPALPSQPSADLTLYKSAHELHFKQRDYARALAAWDHYLQELPRGTFSLEANYNRALCLVRLGRFAEARTALLEFAEGKVGGGYRRDEAKRFIEALDERR